MEYVRVAVVAVVVRKEGLSRIKLQSVCSCSECMSVCIFHEPRFEYVVFITIMVQLSDST